MAPDAPRPPRCSSKRLRPWVVLGAGALLGAGGLALSELGAGKAEVAPADVSATDAVSPGGAPTAGPLGASQRARGASAVLVRRADALTMAELTASLQAAQERGGTPIAVVEEPTALRSSPAGRVVEALGVETEFGSPRVHVVVNHKRDWLEVMAAELPNGRTGWIQADHVTIEGTNFSLHAGLGERKLEVRRRGRVVRRIPVTIGGPATPTPTGTFAVTDKLRMTDDGSPYGCCAVAFTGHQPEIPQGWSGGDRLAVHGTPNEGTIGQAASLGCLRADDADMRWLMDRLPLGTPVVIAP